MLNMKTKNYKSNHMLEILSKLNRERKSTKDFCDVSLTAGSRDFSSHKCILGVFSTFYQKLFTVEMREKYENKATVQGVDEDTMETVLNFIYTCNVTITSENVYELLEAANYMDIQQLKKFCVEFLLDEVDVSNCLRFLEYAKLYGIDKVLEKANAVIVENFEAVVQMKEFKAVKFDDFYKILQIKGKRVSSEECIFNSLISWIKHDITSRKKYLAQLFNELELENLSLHFLQNVIGKEELIMNSCECTKILFESTLSRCKAEQSGVSVYQQEQRIKFLTFASKSVWVVDVMKKELKQLPDSLYDHSKGSAVVHNNKVYLISGMDHFVEKMDLNTRSNLKWNLFSNLKISRDGAMSVICDDFIYTVGGYDGMATNSGERYNIRKNCREMIADMKEPRWHPALAAARGLVFVLGGYDFIVPLNTVECFEVQKWRWKYMPPMKVARYQFPSVVFQNKLYAIGGYGDGLLDAVECYDFLKQTWNEVAKLKVPRGGHGACVANGKIYVAGGNTEVVEAYDPARNVWETVANIPLPKQADFVAAF